MLNNCRNCAKQYFCKLFNTVQSCSIFKSWTYTKNYGEIKKEKICRAKIKDFLTCEVEKRGCDGCYYYTE